MCNGPWGSSRIGVSVAATRRRDSHGDWPQTAPIRDCASRWLAAVEPQPVAKHNAWHCRSTNTIHSQGHISHHAHIHSHSQLTDLYLLALAVKNGGRLVSFDQRIPLSAVHGATAEHLVTL